jgi:hypothetical protein
MVLEQKVLFKLNLLLVLAAARLEISHVLFDLFIFIFLSIFLSWHLASVENKGRISFYD